VNFVNQEVRKNVASKIKNQQILRDKRDKKNLKPISRISRVRRQKSLKKILRNVNKNYCR